MSFSAIIDCFSFQST